jgi:hypothetical protein
MAEMAGEAKALNEQSSDEQTKGTSSAGLLLCLGSGFSALLLTGYSISSSEEGRFLGSVLLGLTSAYCFFVGISAIKQHHALGSRFLWALFGLEISKLILLATYGAAFWVQEESWFHFRIDALEYLAILLVAGVSLSVSLLVMTILGELGKSTSGSSATSLVYRLTQGSFVALLAFFAIFLYATYFLSFALAFHDQGTEGPGLYVTPRNGVAKAVEPGTRLGNHGLHCTPDGWQDKVQEVFFRSGSASLACAFDAVRMLDAEGSRDRPLAPGSIAGVLREVPTCAGDTSTAEARVGNDPENRVAHRAEIHNVQILRCLRQVLLEEGRKHRLQVTVLGHATEETPSGRYKSNFDLSLARAQQVELTLSQLLYPREISNSGGGSGPDPEGQEAPQGGQTSDHPPNLEWLLSAVSSEDRYLSGHTRSAELDETPLDPKLSAEVSIQPIPGHLTDLQRAGMAPSTRPDLTLLDYMYFMVYTITTTGYGDMAPVSPFAKFLTAVANLFEIFFLVIVGNVIIAVAVQGACSREAAA